MTTHRSDHAVLAAGLLPNRGDAVLPGRISIALTHAVLEVAAQQRIANLQRELDRLEARAWTPGAAEADELSQQISEVRRQIREGLGLDRG